MLIFKLDFKPIQVKSRSNKKKSRFKEQEKVKFNFKIFQKFLVNYAYSACLFVVLFHIT